LLESFHFHKHSSSLLQMGRLQKSVPGVTQFQGHRHQFLLSLDV
jgi:hypothetical protein